MNYVSQEMLLSPPTGGQVIYFESIYVTIVSTWLFKGVRFLSVLKISLVISCDVHYSRVY